MGGERAFIVAALEDNHLGDVLLAKRMVDAAASAGVDAVKVAVRDLDACYPAAVLDAPSADFRERGLTMRDVLSSLELGEAALRDLRAYCRGRVLFYAAPHDAASFSRLAALDVDGWQIDPPVVADVDLLRSVAADGRPVLVAAGMVTDGDVAAALAAFPEGRATLLHCVVGDSVSVAETALGLVHGLRERHRVPVGYLALDGGVESSVAAFALGARVLEAPFTLERALRGPSHARSLDREALIRLVEAIRGLEVSLAAAGPRVLLPVELEAYVQTRKALVAARDLAAGTVLTADMLVTRSPSAGVSARLLPRLVGKRLLYDLPADRPLTFGDVDA